MSLRPGSGMSIPHKAADEIRVSRNSEAVWLESRVPLDSRRRSSHNIIIGILPDGASPPNPSDFLDDRSALLHASRYRRRCPDLHPALEMARIAVGDSIAMTACTPHIYPGLYDNMGARITQQAQALSVVDSLGLPGRTAAQSTFYQLNTTFTRRKRHSTRTGTSSQGFHRQTEYADFPRA